MTHKPDTARNASGMERVGKRKLGYNVAQVDAFLERAHTLYESDEARLTQQDIQEISFDLERNGYVIGQVDAALSRLERAVVDKYTEQEISECGRVAWKARAEELYRKLLKHAQRDYRERFDNGASRRPSYARKQVDIMVDQALDKIALMLGHELEWETDENTLNDINSTYVSNVIFTQKTGKHGYDERQVDYYLNACVRLLSSLESLKRLDKYVDSDYSGHSLVEAIAAASAAEDKRASAAAASAASAASAAPSFAPAAKVSSAASVDSSAASSAEKGEDSNVLPKITRSQLVPNVPDHEKQSIFAPVDYNNQSSSDSFEALHQSERAIFTAHAAESKSANLEDEDSNDELLQSATVMHNSSSNTVPPTLPPTVKPVAKPSANTSVPPSVPPAFPPVSHRTNEAAESAPAPAPAAPASSIPSFPPAAPAKRASDSMQIPVTHLEPSKPLSLDIPDLSFPIIGHIDESTSFNNDSDNDDTNDDTSDGLA
ncbi:DivIVA domain-containing protein [Gardnerella greenwoodii]|uniref:DivIVA domain-containing protein n=1 Tax=Gardnerella greenwoodii TaxID=2914925 RepID=UPI0003133167|nr:DivIVA domain-containing protein [Gardnerella greenwoodii]